MAISLVAVLRLFSTRPAPARGPTAYGEQMPPGGVRFRPILAPPRSRERRVVDPVEALEEVGTSSGPARLATSGSV